MYSTSVWDQWYDFVRWSEGKGLSSARVDATSFVTARVADAAAGRKADSHLLLLDEASPDDVIQTFRLIARAYWFWDAVRYKVVADRPGSPAATYDDRHVSKSSILDFDRNDLFDRANKITVWYTDIANNWQQKPMSLATATVDAGTEDAIEEEYRLPHIHDPAQVQSLLTYLLNARLYDVRIRERWLAITSDRQLGDIVSRFVESRDLTVPVRLLRRTKNPDNSFEVELFEHNDAKFAEYVLADSPKLQSTLPDPTVPPPNVDAASIGWTEELYQTPTGDWLPKGTITFTPPPSFPFLDTVEIWLSINGGAQRHWFDTAVSPAFTPTLWETGTYTLTLKTKHRITQAVSSGTAVAVAVTGVSGAVPDVVSVAGHIGDRYWSMPQTRSITRYGASNWSHTGLTSFAAAAVNDGVLSSTAVTTPSGTAQLQFDAGVGATKAFRELAYYHFATLVSTPWIEYSDNGTSWTAVNQTATREPYTAAVGVTGQTIAWEAAGAHRFWRITFAGVNSFTEFHFSEYIGQFSQVREFRVYDVRSGIRKHYTTVPVGAIPTAVKALSVEPIMTSVASDWNTDGSTLTDVVITVVNSAGVESAGVRSTKSDMFAAAGGQADYIPQQQTNIVLSNGVNLSVPLPSGPGFVRATGPTGAFSIGGLSFFGGGTTTFFCNATAYPMTVLHEYASADDFERIATPSGASVVIQPGGIVAFTRDGTAERWRMWWDSIEWTNVTGKPTAIARIQNLDGSYGSIDIAGSTGLYAGIRFPDAHQDATLMLHTSADIQGFYRQEAGAWSWYWQNGVLTVGSVPWANVTSRPTTLSGYGITDAAPLNSPGFTGTPTAPTPAISDNSTKLATTAFVQSAVASGGGGEGLLSTTTLAPSAKVNSSVFTSTTKPGQMLFNETTITSLTPVNVLSITGKGRLRFLGVGHSTAGGTVRLNIIVDGVTRVSDAQPSGPLGGMTGSSLVVPVVGTTATAAGPTTGTYIISPIPEDGVEFNTSLAIEAYVFNGTGYVGWSHRLYA